MTAPRSDDPPAPPRPSTRPAFGALFFFCLGALVAKLVAGALPSIEGIFSSFVYAGIALGFALAYRRFVRRTMEERRRERARREASTPAPGTPDR